MTMTKSEAIQCIKHELLITVNRKDLTGQAIGEALDMAIDALSEPSGDLISRADAIRWVKTECNQYGKPTLEFESGKRVIEHLKQMPSAVCDDCIWTVCNYNKVDWDTPSAEAVQGEWICKGDYAVCSKCGGSSGTQFDGVEPIPKTTAFCPNCGARMKGGDDE